MVKFLVFITYFISIWVINCDISLESLRNCLEDQLRGKKFRSISNEVFTLHYGDPAVEVFNVLTQRDIKSIEFLNFCVKSSGSSLFQPRSVLKL